MIEAIFRSALDAQRDKALAEYQRARASEIEEIEWAKANHRSASDKCWQARFDAEHRLRTVECMLSAIDEASA